VCSSDLLAVAQGVIAQPRLLILDEPSSGLAPLVVDRILSVAAELCATGMAVLLVEQLVEKALRHAHRCVLVETGRVVAEGSADEIRGSEVLERVYLGSHVSG
jgi:branched-chain amino acid transport system ATP-binding protein